MPNCLTLAITVISFVKDKSAVDVAAAQSSVVSIEDELDRMIKRHIAKDTKKYEQNNTNKYNSKIQSTKSFSTLMA